MYEYKHQRNQPSIRPLVLLCWSPFSNMYYCSLCIDVCTVSLFLMIIMSMYVFIWEWNKWNEMKLTLPLTVYLYMAELGLLTFLLWWFQNAPSMKNKTFHKWGLLQQFLLKVAQYCWKDIKIIHPDGFLVEMDWEKAYSRGVFVILYRFWGWWKTGLWTKHVKSIQMLSFWKWTLPL